jgi:hypothetical protein
LHSGYHDTAHIGICTILSSVVNIIIRNVTLPEWIC